jgi:hypothetical protein
VRLRRSRSLVLPHRAARTVVAGRDGGREPQAHNCCFSEVSLTVRPASRMAMVPHRQLAQPLFIDQRSSVKLAAPTSACLKISSVRCRGSLGLRSFAAAFLKAPDGPGLPTSQPGRGNGRGGAAHGYMTGGERTIAAVGSVVRYR